MLVAAQGVMAQGIETVYRQEATTFQVYAPQKAGSVVLRLYNEGTGGKPYKTVKMTPDPQRPWLWRAAVDGDLNGKFYTYDVIGSKKEPKETPGIFARAVGVNGQRGAIVDMNETDPEGWKYDSHPDRKSPADNIIYELHHRDFTIDPSSGVENKGKYLALTEQATIAHLLSLGVNAVHIMPSFDYAAIDETQTDKPLYDWGYNAMNYNVPEGSYATDPYDPVKRIKEFKEMVHTLHEADISVILDVSYSHVYDLAKSNFQRTYPGYFFRKDAKGNYSNGTGYGNETATERDMVRLFIIESLKYWVREYHVDGFRFELMGTHDIETMKLIEQVLHDIDSRILLYGEGWSAGDCAYPKEKLATTANIRQMPGIASLSNELRDALRGPADNDAKGAFLAGIQGSEESIKAGIVGMIEHPQVDYSRVNPSKTAWAEQPTQTVNRVSSHDGMCLTDRLRSEMPGIADDELIRLDLLAQTAVLVSQGIPSILCGEEMLRDKKGMHDSSKASDEVNRIDWSNKERYPAVFDYYKNLIQLRKKHPAFHLGDADLVRKHLSFLPAQPCTVAFTLTDNAGEDSWKDIVVVLNANKQPVAVDIPEGDWTVVCKEGIVNEEGLGQVSGGRLTVSPQSALIIHN